MKRVAVVGAGPAGLFAAHELARNGFEVLVYDMGREVSQRDRKDPFDLLSFVRRSAYFVLLLLNLL